MVTIPTIQSRWTLFGCVASATLLFTAAPSMPASHEFLTFRFTAPADYVPFITEEGESTLVAVPVDHYEGVVIDQNYQVWIPPLHAKPNTQYGPPIPAQPGQPDSLSILWPTYNRMPCLLYVISVDAKGNRSDSSNAIAIIAGVPADTNAFDTSTNEWTRTRPLGITGVATWVRAPGDHRWSDDRPQRSPWSEVPTLSLQGWIQDADRYVLCHMFSDSLGRYWAKAGERQRDCPNQ